ncbi:MAG TPA: amino acid permease [Tepidisphaeraceae bacterium]|jgi:amino acid transporter|nr:amino acid permease [Tepidisphaeraceae bacterium]
MSDTTSAPNAGSSESEHNTLVRAIGPVTLIIYGVGSMLGAGIYGLIGEAAGRMGSAIWLAFLCAMVAALLTGLSYANLGSRYPRAAGAAYATHRAYRLPLLTYVVGLAIVASGLTSMATGSRVIGEQIMLAVSAVDPKVSGWPIVIAAVYLVLLSGLVFRGIKESMWFNIVCTAVEAGGLLLVIAVGMKYWGSVNYLQGPVAADGSISPLTIALVLQGGVLTFFSFIGFEDILNVAEECKTPTTTIPIGLVGAMLISTAIYMAVAITAVSVLPPAELATKNLRGVIAVAAPWFPPALFTVITCFAVANTALLNYVMASRLIYGMSRQGLMPTAMGRVHRTRRTPHVAIFTLLGIILILMLSGQVGRLADATVLLLLTVFTIVNVALVILKFRPAEPRGRFEVPFVIPLLGAGVCATLLITRVAARGKDGYFDWAAPLTAGVLIAGIVTLYFVLHPKKVVMDD